MKRGLKVNTKVNRLPQRDVTTATPMKRGLKGMLNIVLLINENRYNRYPDEKGTESGVDHE